jgi:hypothetical protein
VLAGAGDRTYRGLMVRLLRPILLVVVVLLVGAPMAQAADVDFEPVVLGSTPDVQRVELVNEGDDDLALGGASVTGADAASFAIDANYCLNDTLAPGEDCDVHLRFDPQRVGLNEGRLEIGVTGSSDALTATLAGEGREALRVAPSAVDFGSVPVYHPSQPPLPPPFPYTRNVVVENVSGEAISPVRALMGTLSRRFFSITANGCTGQTLTPGSTCSLTIGLTNLTAGTHTDTLRVIRGSRTVATAALTGTVVEGRRPAPPAPPAPQPKTPDATPTLRARLQAAFGAWRKQGVWRLRRGGFVIGGVTAPVYGDAYLLVRSGKRIVAQGSAALVAGKSERLRGRVTRFGRSLLAERKTRRLDVVLRFVAASDRRVSRVATTVRVPAR